MTGYIDVHEIRMGRNFIRLGDTVKVGPSRPNKRDGFHARVERIEIDQELNPIAFHVVGPRGFRVIPPTRISRVAQTRDGQPKEHPR